MRAGVATAPKRRRARWLTLLELGIDPASLPAGTLHQVRVVSAATVVLVAVAATTGVQYASIGVHAGALAIALGCSAALANLMLLRATRRPVLAAHLGLGVLVSNLVVGAVLTGGFGDPGSLIWFTLAPIAAALVHEPRGALWWLAATSAILVALWALPLLGLPLPSRIPREFQHRQELWGVLTALVAIALLSTSFVTGQRRAERELARANDDLRDETALVRLLMHGAVAANESLSLEEALGSCIAGVCEATGWAFGHAYRVTEEGRLESAGLFGGDARSLDGLIELTRDTRFAPGEGGPGRVLATREALLIPDLRAAPNGPRSADARRVGIAAVVATPVWVHGEIAAVLEFGSREPLASGQRVLDALSLLGVLIGRVAEREALHSRLRQSQKIEAVGQLAAGLAHEINNPMAYVRSNLRALRSEWSELRKELEGASPRIPEERFEECEALLDESMEGVDRAVAIVREVKDFSHAGRAVWDRVDVNEVVESALRVALAQDRAGASVERDLEELPPVRGSESQLQQVFVNLLVNALQAVGDGGRIRVESRAAGRSVSVRVQDDGPGIAPEARERLFEPFFTTKPVGEGTGLGLYISYEILRNHGGSIRASQAPGGGALFEVSIPCRGDLTGESSH